MKEIIKSDECNVWKVLSKNKTEFYEVRKDNDTCSCDLRCYECKMCIHSYICSCPDSAIQFNMCKHIHLVLKLVNQEVIDNAEETEENVLHINDEPVENIAQKNDSRKSAK